MLTRQSIIESHEVNFGYGYARRGELDHQESAFVGPLDLIDHPEDGVPPASAGELAAPVVSVTIELGLTSSGMRVVSLK